MESFMDGIAHRLSGREFLFHASENKNVGIHCHTDRENEAGNTRSSKRHGDKFEKRKHHHHIHTECYHRKKTRQAIPKNKKNGNNSKPIHPGVHAVFRSFLTECRANRFSRKEFHLVHGKRARIKPPHKPFCFFGSKFAGDLRLAAEDLFAHNRRRDRFEISKIAVKINCNRFTDILFRNTRKQRGTFLVELKTYDRFTSCLVELKCRALKVTPRKTGCFVWSREKFGSDVGGLAFLLFFLECFDRFLICIYFLLAFFLHKFECRSFSDQLNRFVHISNPGKFHNESAFAIGCPALNLHKRFCSTEKIHAALNDIAQSVH